MANDPGPSQKQLLSADDIRRAIARLAHEVVERNEGVESLVLVGLRTRGIPLARRVQQRILEFEQVELPLGELDVTLYRDDVHHRAPRTLSQTSIPVDIEDQTVILVDDVLYTGRTIRAALDALIDLGRPRAIQLLCLVGRAAPISSFQPPSAPLQQVRKPRRHVLDLDDFSVQEIEAVLATAAAMKDVLHRPIKKVPTLRGKTLVTLFYEASTRTRVA